MKYLFSFMLILSAFLSKAQDAAFQSGYKVDMPSSAIFAQNDMPMPPGGGGGGTTPGAPAPTVSLDMYTGVLFITALLIICYLMFRQLMKAGRVGKEKTEEEISAPVNTKHTNVLID